MSDKMRWRYGETNPVVAHVAANTEIEVGDLLYLDNGKAIPAAAIPPEASIAATQAAFSATFLGVAMQKSTAGNSTPIRIATTGVFEFDAPAATYGLGNLIGLHESSVGSPPANQHVTKVLAANQAIGRVIRVEPVATTAILVAIKSVVMNGPYA